MRTNTICIRCISRDCLKLVRGHHTQLAGKSEGESEKWRLRPRHLVKQRRLKSLTKVNDLNLHLSNIARGKITMIVSICLTVVKEKRVAELSFSVLLKLKV